MAKYYKPTVSSGDVDPFANQQAPITQPTGTTTGTTNTNNVTGNEESGSGVSLIEESGMIEPEVTSDEDIANDNSDSNQPGN